jgi:hypothetical protein
MVMPVTRATGEMQVGGLWFQAHPGKNKTKTLSDYLKNK